MRWPRIHREGRNAIFVVALLVFVINVMVYMLVSQHWALAVSLILSAILLIFVSFFFRSPVRILEVNDPELVIAPADGRVVVIEEVEETEFLHEKRLQVSIFMSPFNVHANWYPVEGKILLSHHQHGRHKGAWLPKSSTENERSAILIETATHQTILVRQIAGAMARRIVTYAAVGKSAHRNEHLGFIKLGSRVDLYLPLDTKMYVGMGEPVRGNETILARLQAPKEQENKA